MINISENQEKPQAERNSSQENLECYIFRSPHDRENPYAQISREMLRDRDLSLKAKGLLSYLLSLKDDWKIYHSQLMHALNIGESCLTSTMQELIDKGYAKRERSRNEKGMYTPYRYEISEFKRFLPNGKIQPGSSSPENQDLRKNEEIKIVKDVVVSDSGPVAPSSLEIEKIKKIGKAGKEFEISKQDLFTISVQQKRDWTAQEIDELWEILKSYQLQINDLFHFLDGIIANIRQKKSIQNFNQQDKQCKNLNTKVLNKQQKNSKKETLTKDISVRPLVTLGSLMKKPKKS